MEILDVRLLGVSAESGQKLLLTAILLLTVYLVQKALRAVLWLAIYPRASDQVRFWVRQAIAAFSTLVVVLGGMSIWFEQPSRLAAALGIITVAIGFALQQVILAFAGYFVILRGRTYRIGERIAIGELRGDVIAVGFIHTTLMEMGEPGDVTAPGGWVKSRQYTGRVVSVSNARVFDQSVHNFTRDFPFVWDEISVPIKYSADRARAESVLLEAAQRHTVKLTEIGAEALQTMQRRYFVRNVDLEPRVYYRLTDNWLELTVRFLARDREIRELKDRVSRDILASFEESGIEVASATYDITGLPALKLTRANAGGR